jgi:small subunit ribosomal protein S17
MQRPRGQRKSKEGQVISDRMDKTVVVAVQRLVRHPLYGRTVRKTSKLKAHDEGNECGVGDVVRIEETRPLSKEKRWRVVEIVRKAR